MAWVGRALTDHRAPSPSLPPLLLGRGVRNLPAEKRRKGIFPAHL